MDCLGCGMPPLTFKFLLYFLYVFVTAVLVKAFLKSIALKREHHSAFCLDSP